MQRPTTASAAPFLALACVGLIATAPAHAAEGEAADEQDSDRQIVVTGDVYETRQESPKVTRPLRDTPQTVTVITRETIEQQNLLTLRDVLTTVPGITFGAGEGGGGYGDSILMRGFSANTDITQDGVRDSAQYSRTDSFNLEQLEVVNGANSVYGGSGSVGGSINIVTKRPLPADQIVVAGGVGTDSYYRGTVDANQRLGDTVAARLNAMYHHNDIPGRDWEKYERWGVAPSVTVGMDSPTRLTLQYLHQEDTNVPSYGVPYFIGATNDGPLPGVDNSSYFGFRNVDTQEINVDQATVTIDHDLTDQVSIRNLSRWQDVRQFAIVNPPQGTFCLASGLLATGVACPATTPPGFYLPSGPRGTTRDTRNQLLYNQTDLRAVFDTGGIEHTLVLGAAYTWEKFFLVSGNSLRNADGTPAFASFPLMSIGRPNDIVQGPAGFTYGNNVYTGPVNFIPTAQQEGQLDNYAIYLFDTLAFGNHFELNGGVRYERNEGSFRPDTVVSTGPDLGLVTPGETVENNDNLFSYRVGLVYKPIEPVSLYVAYGNSKAPSKTSVNGSCTIAGENGATASTCNVKPESAKIYEIGAKAEVADGRLLLSASAFRNERDQYKVASADPTVPDQQLDGAARVNGIALSAVGQILPRWSITANYTYLDSKVIRSIALNSPPGTVDPQAGNPLPGTPKHSGSLFTTYSLPFGLTIGYGLTYQGSFYLSNATPTPDTVLYKVPDYLIHNAFVAYEVNDRFGLQLNVKNFTDEEYFTRVRTNASSSVQWATPGEAMSVTLSGTVKL